jgi:hypothetical protein
MICAIFLRPPENSDVNSGDTETIETDILSGQVVFPLENSRLRGIQSNSQFAAPLTKFFGQISGFSARRVMHRQI